MRARPWLVLASLAALLVLVAGSATVPVGQGAAADPLPTTSSAPNLNQLDERYGRYQHGPAVQVEPHGGPDKIQWCWIEQNQTGEMSLVPCARATEPPPDSHPGYPAGD